MNRTFLSLLTSCLLVNAFNLFSADFNEVIRPILNKNCVECHGPKKQKGDLRFDAKIYAMKGGHDGPAIVAGSVNESLLYQRITSLDEEERMPPKGPPLSPSQILLLKEWIEQGAEWPENESDHLAKVDKRLDYWSVQPLKKNFEGINSIDQFIRKTLIDKGLEMSPLADRRTLIRRLSFDLVGLPPSPERVEQFVSDSDPNAYEKLVDELLASPHHGERWARHWLDIAHYADTHGFERDMLRPNAWHYRDYVIESLNNDKPYDRFIKEQIAGDVLAPKDPQSIIATGFLASGPWDFVGHVETKSGVLKRAARAGDLDDMVTQVITSTMAITINCARCHDHKLDPISQEEYFQLMSVFAGVKRGNRQIDPIKAKKSLEEKGRLEKQLGRVKTELKQYLRKGVDLADIVGGGNGYGTGTEGLGILLETGKFTKKKEFFHQDIIANKSQAPLQKDSKLNQNKFIKAVFLPDGNKGDEIQLAEGVLLKGLPKTSGSSWDAIRNGKLNAQVHSSIDGIDYSDKKHSMLGLHANAGITFDLDEIRKANSLENLQLKAVVGFGASPTASKTKADFAVYLDSERKVNKLGLKKTESLKLDIKISISTKFLTLMATDGGDGISSDLLFLGDPQLLPEQYAEGLDEKLTLKVKALEAERGRLEKLISEIPQPKSVYAVLSESKPPVIHVQRRGNPENKGKKVLPAAFTWAKHAPAAFGDNTTPEGQRRKALAEWITHPKNPLTPRVLVNRLWHHHFGQGLVSTPSDFGLGGNRPSHPELLDWLSNEFMKSNLSLKYMHKVIVMSSTYRQQSMTLNDKASAMDSQNTLLWRQNPRRLDAESFHDAVLATSGTLNLRMGGPGYRDFNYTSAYAPLYEYITPDKPELWRRSIYRFIVRTTPHSFLSTLDCPDPANLTPVRAFTTTALQALALSNNDFILQQAEHLTRRIENETNSIESAIARAFALAFQRVASETENQAAFQLVKNQGLFHLCRMLMNSNEFIYLD